MKATFPHLLHLDIALGVLYPLLGIEIVPPPPITQKTIEIGVKLAPQNACFPLKVTLGNFIESIERGADTLFMAGGVGPCRFGYYGQIQRLILEDLGYDVRFVLLDHPRYGVRPFLEALRTMAGGKLASLRVARVASLAWKILRFTEDLEAQRRALRCQVEKREALDQVIDSALERLRRVESVDDFHRIKKEAEDALHGLPLVKGGQTPIKVGIVGEVYVAQETRINFNVEKILGDLGVYVHNSVSTVEYVLHTLPLTRSQEKQEAWAMAKPYLKRFVGGEGIDSVGSAIRYARKGFDGVVHLYPFTCMPEIVAKGILNKVSKDYDLPVLHLAIDEHSGEAGLITRVEAFVDVLERRKKTRKISEVGVAWISS
ncbi:MAG: acyl-CoA dehydratase activase-related protein [Candidatus Caldatribacteriaceae bacterium]